MLSSFNLKNFSFFYYYHILMCFFPHRTSGLPVLAERTEGEFRNNKTKQKQEKQSKTKSFE